MNTNINQYFDGLDFVYAGNNNHVLYFGTNEFELDLLTDNQLRSCSVAVYNGDILRLVLPKMLYKLDAVDFCELLATKGVDYWRQRDLDSCGQTLSEFIAGYYWSDDYHDCELDSPDDDDERILRELYAQGLTLPEVAEAFTAHCADMGNTVVNADSYARAIWEMLCDECNLTDEQLRL